MTMGGRRRRRGTRRHRGGSAMNMNSTVANVNDMMKALTNPISGNQTNNAALGASMGGRRHKRKTHSRRHRKKSKGMFGMNW